MTQFYSCSVPPERRALPDVRPRVVLDTNVWIDILVFDDPASRPIASALEGGGLDAAQNERCTNELRRVLRYPQFVRYAIDNDAALARLARLSTRIAPAMRAECGAARGVSAGARTAASAPRALPLCRDRDDQKFLELALAAGAQWLITKDRALLKMARRIARDFGFNIVEPRPFVTAAGLAPPASGSDAAHPRPIGAREKTSPQQQAVCLSDASPI